MVLVYEFVIDVNPNGIADSSPGFPNPGAAPPSRDFIPEADAYRGELRCCPALSSELGLLLLTNQVVRGSARRGLRNTASPPVRDTVGCGCFR